MTKRTRFLYLAKRTDAGKDQCWGDNLEMVVCVNTSDHLEELIKLNLLQDNCDAPAKTTYGELLTRDDILVTYLGKAEPSITLGVITISNAGA